ncbi:MAG: VOC family protein [Alphaproteobacteria bacterium]|nr:VOC family protein [Alphaproteobacteria bacterium]
MSGEVVWFEVMGQDAKKLHAFYGTLFGWDLKPAPGAMEYGMVERPAGGIPGGVGKAPAGTGWTTFYVSVDDLDASIARATGMGATVVSPPVTMPDGTTIALLHDPEGHTLGLVKTAA